MRKKRILAIGDVHLGMRSFFINGKRHIEGMPAYAKSLFGLLENGYEVHLICVTEQPLNPPNLENLYIYDIHIRKFSYSIYNNSIYSKLQACLPYFKALYTGVKLTRKLQFDLIYGYGSSGFLAGVLSMIVKIPNIRRVFGTFLYPMVSKGTILQKLKAFIKDTSGYLLISLPTSALIITNDGTHGDKVAAILGQPSSKIHYLYNGVDKNVGEKVDIELARQTIGKIKKDEQQPILVHVSRLDYWKRVDRAIMALKYVDYKPTPLLVIIGDGPCKQELEQLVRKVGLEDYVHFLGQIPHEEALSIVAVSDISLSLYDLANLGNVLIESMTLGKCIISLNDGSLDGVIENGFNGILLDKPEPRLIASAIDDLLENPNKLQKYGRSAMKRAFEIFDSWDERVRKEIDIIERVIASETKI